MSEKTFINDIVVTSRIRFARNISGFPFPSRASDEEALKVSDAIKEATLGSDSLGDEGFAYVSLDTLGELNRRSLVERHIISGELGESRRAGAVVSRNEEVSVMINEEDHVRLQCILSGFNLKAAYETANRVDEAMQDSLSYSFSNKYGFLTACPSNVGTALRAGVMVHIPALVLSGKLSNIASLAQTYGLAIRGMYGEGSEALGDLFQISNQYSLGYREEEIVNTIHMITKQIIKQEREERNRLLITQEDALRDKIQRAYGILTNAYMLSAKESMSLISLLRMGADMEITKEVNYSTLDSLIVNIQPATLSLLMHQDVDDKGRDIFRADYIRKQLIN